MLREKLHEQLAVASGLRAGTVQGPLGSSVCDSRHGIPQGLHTQLCPEAEHAPGGGEGGAGGWSHETFRFKGP